MALSNRFLSTALTIVWLLLLSVGLRAATGGGPGLTMSSSTTKTFGRYHWTLRTFDDPSGVMDGHQHGILTDVDGRTVVDITEHHVFVDGYRPIVRGGSPCLLLRTWSGSNRGSYTYYLYRLGPSPRCLLVYDKGMGGEWGNDFTVKDLDGDGSPEILTWYDGFTAWDCSMSGSARIPLVLGYRGGRFVDMSRRYPHRLKAALADTLKRLRLAVHNSNGEPLKGDGFSPVVQYYAIDLLLTDRRHALRDVYHRLRAIDRPEFRRRRPIIEAALRERSIRYAYPAVYGHVDVNAIFRDCDAALPAGA